MSVLKKRTGSSSSVGLPAVEKVDGKDDVATFDWSILLDRDHNWEKVVLLLQRSSSTSGGRIIHTEYQSIRTTSVVLNSKSQKCHSQYKVTMTSVAGASCASFADVIEGQFVPRT